MNRLLATLAIALVTCVAASSWLWRELRAERDRADASQARVLELERMQAASMLEIPPVAPADSSSAPASAAVPVRKQETGVEPAPSDAGQKQSTPPDYFGYEARMLRNPKYREARRAHRQMQLASGHLDLAESLQISQEQADRLLDLLVDQELRFADDPRRNPINEEEVQERQLRVRESQRANDAELTALLGESKLAQWKEYQASLQTRHQVQQLRTTLAAGPEPLRGDQIQPLVDAMYAEQKRVKEELAAYTATLAWSGGMDGQSHSRRNERHAQLAAAASERIQTAAESILTQQQLETLDGVLQRQLDMENAKYEVMRAVDGMQRRGKLGIAKSN